MSLVAGGLVAAALVVSIVWWVPTLFYGYVPEARDRAAAEATTRTGMLAGLAGLAALGTFWLNNRVYQITARTFEVTEQGHITERYTRAIDHLGDEELDVHLGGIYALERLAVDSARDHPTVVEVLSAFIRERSRVKEATSTEILHFRNRWPDALPPPHLTLPTDVQAAVTVLARLPTRDGVRRADLPHAHLAYGQLQHANLAGADLRGCDLTGANFSRANLAGVDLSEGAIFTGTNFEKADLPAPTSRKRT